MQRRRLLATLAAAASGGFAGCGASGSNSPTQTPTTCDDHAPRRIELTGIESIDATDLSIAPTVQRARSTSTAPATLTVTITNEGDDRAVDVTDGPRCHPFDRGRGRSDPRGLWLYRAGDTPDDRAGECWTRAAVPPDSVGFDGRIRATFADTPLEGPMNEFATRWAHVTPWLRPVWMSGWDFVWAIGAALVGLGWVSGELIAGRHKIVAGARRFSEQYL